MQQRRQKTSHVGRCVCTRMHTYVYTHIRCTYAHTYTAQRGRYASNIDDMFGGEDNAGFAGKEGKAYVDREKGRSDSISLSDLPSSIDIDAISSGP